MDIEITGVNTHRLVLLDTLSRIHTPVLELGAGDNSTYDIHNYAKRNNVLGVTVETNKEWAERYASLENEYHKIMFIEADDLEKFHQEDNVGWGMVFIDSLTWEMRNMAINKYKDTVDYLVIHDTGYAAEVGQFGTSSRKREGSDCGARDFSGTFKYWIEYLPYEWKETDPPTVLGSNKIDVRGREINGMIISNRSL